MRAAWFVRRGPAADVFRIGEMPTPEPGAGDVRVRIRFSGISPGDVGKRGSAAPNPYPLVIPHSDGAGVIDAVGDGVDQRLLGRNVWCYGAQSYRAFGTAAEYCVLPVGLTVELPDDSDDELLEQSASLGIAGITGYRALFADGSVSGLAALVYGATGGVGSIAAQMATRDGALVIAVVRRESQRAVALAEGAAHAFLETDPHLIERILAVAPNGVDRVADLDFARHIDLNSRIIGIGATISSYMSTSSRPSLPYWPLGFADTTLRLLGSDDFAPAVKSHAARELTAALLDGTLHVRIARRLPLERIVEAHEHIEAGRPSRVLITL